jgi:hypothetical protein
MASNTNAVLGGAVRRLAANSVATCINLLWRMEQRVTVNFSIDPTQRCKPIWSIVRLVMNKPISRSAEALFSSSQQI